MSITGPISKGGGGIRCQWRRRHFCAAGKRRPRLLLLLHNFHNTASTSIGSSGACQFKFIIATQINDLPAIGADINLLVGTISAEAAEASEAHTIRAKSKGDGKQNFKDHSNSRGV